MPASKPKAKAPASKASSGAAAKAPARKKSGTQTDDSLYTDPALRHRLKEKIQAGDKGGRPGQWSARKSQLLVAEYEKEGGGYKKAARSKSQKNLEHWTEEKWQTADGTKAARGKTTARYLPKVAWEKLTPDQRRATDDKKKKGSRTGQQNTANTAPAKRARKVATK
jgi:hypothetical protein